MQFDIAWKQTQIEHLKDRNISLDAKKNVFVSDLKNDYLKLRQQNDKLNYLGDEINEYTTAFMTGGEVVKKQLKEENLGDFSKYEYEIKKEQKRILPKKGVLGF